MKRYTLLVIILIISFLYSGFFFLEPLCKPHGPISQAEYVKMRLQLSNSRNRLMVEWNQIKDSAARAEHLSEVGKTLHKTLTDSIFPAWYGTVWDFNGYSDVPREGTIACGYFVSTTLKHAGFNLNRFKLAQQYSHAVVNSLCGHKQIIKGTSAFLNVLMKLEDGLFIVGLDNHVGFISIESGQAWFIHSSYMDPIAVIREKASESVPLMASQVYVLGSLTGYGPVMEKWLKGDPIVIVP